MTRKNPSSINPTLTPFFNRLYLGELIDSDCFLSAISFLIFYFHRAQQFSGDGALIARMTEGGKWLVQNELLSQAFLQLLYRFAAPFNSSALEIMNFASCVGGAASVWILLRYGRFYGVPRQWTLLLFFSSVFFIYSCGHTEYYPILLPFMLLYGYTSILYLRGRIGIALVSASFVLACGMHFAMLIALPSFLMLPLLKDNKRDWGSAALWLVLIVPLVLIRNYPQILGHKAAALSVAWNFLPWFPYEGMYQHYAVFQWEHCADWFYAWSMRSWIFWPFLLIMMVCQGWKSLWNGERFFLFIYTVGFTFWTFLWHPDLGVEADWDLFGIETAPCLLLTIAFLPAIRIRNYLRFALGLACVASIPINYAHICEKLDLPRRGYGAIEVRASAQQEAIFTVDGLQQDLSIPRIREGIYQSRFIDRTNRRAYEFHIVVQPNRITRVEIDSLPSENSK